MKKILLSLLLLSCHHIIIAAENIKVTMVTDLGEITLELYPEKAPKTVANFVQYIEQDFYNNTQFHRVIKNFMIQGGGFTPEFIKKETLASIVNEADNGLTNDYGTIAMARTGNPHSATAEFFINTKNNSFLNHTNKTMRGWGYCVFGKVTAGLDIIKKIEAQSTGPGGHFTKDVPNPAILITKIYLQTASKAEKK